MTYANTGIQYSIPRFRWADENPKNAWKFAVDTDNNGKKDTYTLYGIYFRSPTRDTTTGQFNRKRNPLEARTPPMDNANTNTNVQVLAVFLAWWVTPVGTNCNRAI
jgi:hypothetical protein